MGTLLVRTRGHHRDVTGTSGGHGDITGTSRGRGWGGHGDDEGTGRALETEAMAVGTLRGRCGHRDNVGTVRGQPRRGHGTQRGDTTAVATAGTMRRGSGRAQGGHRHHDNPTGLGDNAVPPPAWDGRRGGQQLAQPPARGVGTPRTRHPLPHLGHCPSRGRSQEWHKGPFVTARRGNGPGGWHRARCPPPGVGGGVVAGVVVSPMSPYHDGVAGAGGQEDVVGLGGDAIATLDVARHVLPHQLDAGAGAVGA